MEVQSTTNPIPPTGGTNAVAPLGISASMSVSKTTELTSSIFPDWFNVTVPIKLTTFVIDNGMAPGTVTTTWDTAATGLSQYDPSEPNSGFLPWNLIQPFYSKMHRMEYSLLLKPVKVEDVECRQQVIYSYNDDQLSLTTRNTCNHNEVFSFDSTNDIKIISVPQFFMHNNIATNRNYFVDELNSTINEYVPRTQLTVLLVNSYRPNVAQPTQFDTMKFLIVKPTNMKVIAARRYVKGTLTDNNKVIYPLPNFM